MEPFFIFCLVLVGYCAYLTMYDLLMDLKIAPAVTVHKASTRLNKQVSDQKSLSRHRVPVTGGRAVCTFGQLASL